ncbi:reverse gyrase, partial [bacterium]|nr:reverse gyrase [bacterium]
MSVKVCYRNFCPNCGGDISSSQLIKVGVCKKCWQKEEKNFFTLLSSLEQAQKLQGLKEYYLLEKETKRFNWFFSQEVGNPLGKIKRFWAQKVLQGDSLALIAPVGAGKTTFALLIIRYLLKRKKIKRAYVVVPTKALVRQTQRRLKGCSVLAYLGKKEEKEKIKRGDFEVLITTANFLHRNLELICAQKFDLVFVDDADSFLKGRKRAERLLRVLGFREKELQEGKVRTSSPAQLIVASATVSPTPGALNLLRQFLGFDIAKVQSTERNVARFYWQLKKPSKKELFEKIAQILKLLPSGVFIFFPRGRKKDIPELIWYLERKGFKGAPAEEFLRLQEEFRRGKLQFFAGTLSPYSPLVRGLDIREAKGVVFADLPFYEIDLSQTQNFRLLQFLARSLLLLEFPPQERQFLREFVRRRDYSEQDKEELLGLLQDDKILSELNRRSLFLISPHKNTFILSLPDINTFIQAEGRVSRLSPIGFYRGLSILLFSDKEKFSLFRRRLEIQEDFAVKPFSLSEVRKEVKRIEKERGRLKEAEERREKVPFEPDPTLVIVESPTKAKTIARFFGKPHLRQENEALIYEVPTANLFVGTIASLGHIVDLVTSEGRWGVKEENFLPIYDSIKTCVCGKKKTENLCRSCGSQEVAQDKRKLIETLRQLAFEFKKVYIGTDPDIEEEKIAFDLYCFLKLFGAEVHRIELHEITKRAFLEALANPRQINFSLVRGQILRRIYDRWVGFYLSEFLRETFARENISAGRVQSPVLGWIIERTEEARQKKAQIQFRYRGLPVILEEEDLELARQIVAQPTSLEIEEQEEEKELSPPPPFETNSLLQEAGRRFGWTAPQVMRYLQTLFEHGLITYHRTDSTFIFYLGAESGRRTNSAEV